MITGVSVKTVCTLDKHVSVSATGDNYGGGRGVLSEKVRLAVTQVRIRRSLFCG